MEIFFSFYVFFLSFEVHAAQTKSVCYQNVRTYNETSCQAFEASLNHYSLPHLIFAHIYTSYTASLILLTGRRTSTHGHYSLMLVTRQHMAV